MIARLWTWYFSRTKILFVLWPCDIQFASTHYANPTLRTMGCSGKLSSSHKKMSSEKENTQHNNLTNIEALNWGRRKKRKRSHAVREKKLVQRRPTEKTNKDEDEEEEQAGRYHIMNNRACKMWIPILIFDYGGILRLWKSATLGYIDLLKGRRNTLRTHLTRRSTLHWWRISALLSFSLRFVWFKLDCCIGSYVSLSSILGNAKTKY